MCNVFLLQDLGVFELQVDGSVGPDGADGTLGGVLAQLPDHADAVVDLRDLADLDVVTARRLLSSVELQALRGGRVVVVADDAQLALLELVGFGAQQLADTPQHARWLLNRRDLAAAS